MYVRGCVTRDASLDEFVGGGETGVGSEESGDGGVEAESGDAEAESGGVEVESDDGGSAVDVSSVEATYVWIPAGDACARCAGDSERLWRCDGELVCGECKEW